MGEKLPFALVSKLRVISSFYFTDGTSHNRFRRTKNFQELWEEKIFTIKFEQFIWFEFIIWPCFLFFVKSLFQDNWHVYLKVYSSLLFWFFLGWKKFFLNRSDCKIQTMQKIDHERFHDLHQIMEGLLRYLSEHSNIWTMIENKKFHFKRII